MKQQLLDEDVLDVDTEQFMSDDEDDIWSQQSEEDEMKSWEIGFEMGEEAARNDIRRFDEDY
ncbi:MAG TPA: hypothetical protein VJJ82_04820 [Candidatus Nanoarchaeia archaeon]|nr:hypothetical protein [Candidatus Nanoarchaeia archaeon]